MRSFRLQFLAAAVVAAFGAATTTQAAFVDYKIGNHSIGSYTIVIDGSSKPVGAGGISLTKISGGAGLPNSYITVCTDVGATVYVNNTYGYDVKGFSGQDGIDPNWGADATFSYQAIQNAAWLFYNKITQTSSAADWQTLQLAVWEVLYDTGSPGGFDLDAGTKQGRFHVTSGNATIRSTAETWIGQIPNSFSPYTGWLLYPNPENQPYETSPAVQGLLLDESFTPVPEPTTIVAALLLLVPFGVGTVRMLRNRNRAA